MRAPSALVALMLSLPLNLPPQAALRHAGPRAYAVNPRDLIDINRADVTELLTVPGMTPSWAGRIVRFRPYHSKFDLVQLGVVTPDVYKRIREGIIAHHMPPTDPKR